MKTITPATHALNCNRNRAFHRITSASLFAFFALSLRLTSVGTSAQPADILFVNGSIITVDDNNSIAESLAIRGDRILAIGTESELSKHRFRNTEVVDLQGRSLIPGLIDSHTHPTGASMIEWDHPIPEMPGIDDVLRYIGGRTAVLPAGDWIVLQQVFITRLKERRYPTREELDVAAPNHPVAFRTGPDASLNSLALTKLKITRESIAPEGSKIERQSGSNEPNGIIRNWSRIFSIPSTGDTPDDADKLDQLSKLFQDYNSVGLTTISDRNASSSAMRLYQSLLENHRLSVRIAASRGVGNQGSASQIAQQIELIAREPTTHSSNLMLRTIGIKMFLDGGMLTGSAFMTEPWGVSSIYNITDPEYRGLRFLDSYKLEAAVRACADFGLQFTAHSVGDGAVKALVDTYEKIGSTHPGLRETRPNVTHCNFMLPESIDKMARLGISADIQPAWLYKDARTLTEQFGYERMSRFQPLRTLFEKNVLVGGGSDHMQKIGSLRSVNPYNPFLGMWITMTRTAENQSTPVHPEHALSRLQALRFYTANNARLLFLEDQCGTLEPNKLADLVILDRDFLTCPTDEIRHIQVKQTYLGGVPVYSP